MQTKVMFYLIIFALGTLTSKRAQREYDRRLVLALTDFQMAEPFFLLRWWIYAAASSISFSY
jgi:hypothetical protein